MWKKYGMLCSEQEGCAFYTAAAEFGCRALMMVGITTGIRYDENGQEIFVDLPEREHAQSMDDLVRLALKTAAHAEYRALNRKDQLIVGADPAGSEC